MSKSRMADDNFHPHNRFPHDDRKWRVDWYGILHRNASVPTELTLQVLLTPLKATHVDGSHKNIDYDFFQSRIVDVGIGYLPGMPIGTIWHKGHLVSTPTYTEATFEQVLFDEGAYTIRATDDLFGKPELSGKLTLQPEFYRSLISKDPQWQRLRASCCVVSSGQESGRDKKYDLVIPCGEILRAFYGTSSRFLRRLVQGEVQDDLSDLYNPAQDRTFIDADRKAMIYLRDKTYDADLRIVARMVFSKVARKRAFQINTSLVRNAERLGRMAPEILPPIKGKAILVVEGKWVKSQADDWCFLVFRLLSCEAESPWSELEWGRDNDNTPNPEPDETLPEVGYQPKPSQANLEKDEVSNDYEGDLRSDTAKMLVPEFLDSGMLGVKRIHKTEFTHRSASHKNNEEKSFDGLSTGAGTWGETDHQMLDVVQEDAKNTGAKKQERTAALAATFDEFCMVLLELEKQGVSLFSQAEAISKWKRTSRKVMVVHLSLESKNFYLMEQERVNDSDKFKTLLAWKEDGNELDAIVRDRLLKSCGENRGVWTFEQDDLRQLKRYCFKHTSSSPGEFAARILNKIKESVWVGGECQATY